MPGVGRPLCALRGARGLQGPASPRLQGQVTGGPASAGGWMPTPCWVCQTRSGKDERVSRSRPVPEKTGC